MTDDPRFDDAPERRGTNCSKWDAMERTYGVSAEDGLPMWVADSEFRAPETLRRALADRVAHGVFGYPASDAPAREAVAWWMRTRHGWSVDPDWILGSAGVVNGLALAIDTLTDPGDAVAIMTPVYHAFARVIRALGREVRELPLVIEDGRHALDPDGWEARLTGRERMLILCSPHNPGGRVWTAGELARVADFAERSGMILVSDEVHHDIVYPGARHLPMHVAVPGAQPRLISLTGTGKTFNVAGLHAAHVIVPDAGLRTRLARRRSALGLSDGVFALIAAERLYTPEGAAWADAQVAYLDGNRRLFDAAVAAIPGLSSMPLEATFLAWVDFSGTGMAREEFTGRVERRARIAVNHGPTFGTGGESWLRFNFAAPRAMVAEAAERLADAFSDLQ